MPPSRDRALRVVELLAHASDGLPMSEIAERLAIPKTAIHRLLSDLQHMGYVSHTHDGRFCLTVKIISVALDYLAATGLTDAVQPPLDYAARQSGELVRLAVVNREQLIWIAKAQGAGPGLRYEPGPGCIVNLAATATGLAWLATLPEDQALRLIAEQGLAPEPTQGPHAPRSLQAVLAQLEKVRAQGHAMIFDSNEQGMSALAVPVFSPVSRQALGALCITGPSFRFTQERMQALLPVALETASALGRASRESPLLTRTVG
ncbi:IclR family transcriptional regulator [Kerstersia similis]|uniref:IclR family transcriptional regulator n=1 Tax=Kerstersia similis TaxID=206505 RepID=UPI0039EF2A1D